MQFESRPIEWLNSWARRIVLIETGQAVELIHLEEIDGHGRAFIELPSGLRTHVPVAALTNRLARLAEGGMTIAGVAFAGMALGYTLGLPQAELAAWIGQTPLPPSPLGG